jgi:hypothetical protein
MEGAVDGRALRFADVLEEIRRIADLARRVDRAGTEVITEACGRAESLLVSLRLQFLQDVIVDRPMPSAV